MDECGESFEELSYRISTIVLLCSTVLTVMQLTTLPKEATYTDKTSLSLCVFASLIATAHYFLLSFNSDPRARIMIRHSDWFLTIPVIRLQLITLDNKYVIPRVVYGMIISSVLMVLFSLITELVHIPVIQVVTGSLSILIGEYSIFTLVERKRIPQHLIWCRIVYALYGAWFVLGLVRPQLRTHLDAMISVSDTTIKSTVSGLVVAKVVRTYSPNPNTETP